MPFVASERQCFRRDIVFHLTFFLQQLYLPFNDLQDCDAEEHPQGCIFVSDEELARNRELSLYGHNPA